MKKHVLLFSTLLFLTTISLSAQVTGVKNVPGDYMDLAAAFADLNAVGVGAGGATINILAPQTAPANGYQLGSAALYASLSSANPLTINGNGNTVTGFVGTRAGSLTSGVNDGIFVFIGVDYVTVSNVVFQDLATNNTATTAMENAIAYYNAGAAAGSANGCQFNNVSGCTFNLGNAATSGAAVFSGPYIFNATTTVSWTANSTDIHRSLTLNNNNFANIYNGVLFRGPTTAQARNLVVTNNLFTGVGGGGSTAYGTYMLYTNSIRWNNNSAVGDIAQTTTSYLFFTSTNCGGFIQANGNTVSLQSGTTSSATYGIYALSTIGANRQINNNTLRFGSFPAITSGSLYGLYATYSGGITIF